jgi:hypothetical protein
MDEPKTVIDEEDRREAFCIAMRVEIITEDKKRARLESRTLCSQTNGLVIFIDLRPQCP